MKMSIYFSYNQTFYKLIRHDEYICNMYLYLNTSEYKYFLCIYLFINTNKSI